MRLVVTRARNRVARDVSLAADSNASETVSVVEPLRSTLPRCKLCFVHIPRRFTVRVLYEFHRQPGSSSMFMKKKKKNCANLVHAARFCCSSFLFFFLPRQEALCVEIGKIFLSFPAIFTAREIISPIAFPIRIRNRF